MIRRTVDGARDAERSVVFMDLDGSVLHHDGTLGAGLAEAMARLPRVHWVVLSGRCYRSVLASSMASQLSLDTPQVCDGGSVVASAPGNVLSLVRLSETRKRQIRAGLAGHRAEYIFASSGLGGGLVWPRNAVSRLRHEGALATDDLSRFWREVHRMSVTKLSARLRDPSDCLHVAHARNDLSVDFLPDGVDKSSAMSIVQDILSASDRNCVFVFNDENDVSAIYTPNGRPRQDLATIKVGRLLPRVPATCAVETPDDVVSALMEILGDRNHVTDRS